MSGSVPSLQEAFSEIKDFRHPQGKRYKLQAVLVLTCLAMMHGAQSEEAIAEWGENQGRRWLRLLGIRRRRGPSQATIQRIFKGIDRTHLESVMSHWSKEILTAVGSASAASDPDLDHRVFRRDRELNNNYRPEDSLSALSDWVGLVMSQLPEFDLKINEERRDSLFESLTLSGDQDASAQHVSAAGLKIWGVDYEAIDLKVNKRPQVASLS